MLGAALQLTGCGAQVGSGAPANNGQTLCLNDYIACINPIYNASMQNRTGQLIQCASGGCHEVGAGFAGSLKIYPNISSGTVDPTELANLQLNFLSSLANADLTAPVDSKLLVKPLAGNTGVNGSHTGGDVFPDSADPCYVAIINWITNSVSSQTDPACGHCTTPVLASCGYP